MALTELFIKTVKALDDKGVMITRREFTDGNGLSLEVFHTGQKKWRCRLYNPETRKRKTITLGEYPTISLKQAREMAQEIRRKMSYGHILAFGEDESLRPTQKTFRMVADLYFDMKEAQSKSPINRLKNKDRRRMEIYAYDAFGAKPIDDVTADEITEILQRLNAQKKFDTAHRVLYAIRHVFEHGVINRWGTKDPTIGLQRMVTRASCNHHASISNPSDVAVLMRAILAYPQDVVKNALLMTAYTFLRPGEIRHLEWRDIDQYRPLIVVPADKMKMKEQHMVPISRQVQKLLDHMRGVTGHGRYIFPNGRSPAGDRPMSENGTLCALRAIGYSKEEMTAHGFRSMASTLLNEYGWPSDAIERQLAHNEKNAVRASYNYAKYLPLRTQMMQWWADYLDALRDGTPIPKMTAPQFQITE